MARAVSEDLMTPLITDAHAPMWAVLCFTFANYCASSVIGLASAFVAVSFYKFGPIQLFALSLVMGFATVPGPLLINVIVRRFPALTARLCMVTVMLLLACVAPVPLLCHHLHLDFNGLPIYVTGTVYFLILGHLWPLNVSYFIRSGCVVNGNSPA
eukprot:TRINITY_DN1202_c0_g1_i2.p3 TRINITY_DN1202_c0_g1~~TRINITY_DN1202_c0_g1_i2.p3  ORF type:complete len:156 (-),score=42.97 TRINITY_DN1202_c0_g1_i2:1025-1492(-)